MKSPLENVLLGTAVGDSLGLPAEGLTARVLRSAGRPVAAAVFSQSRHGERRYGTYRLRRAEPRKVRR